MSWKEENIYPFEHRHRMHLCETSGDVRCQDCREYIHGEAYECDSGCSYFLHGSCVGTSHPFHPEHRLEASRLARGCHVCGAHTDMMPSFRCRPCSFHLCDPCARLVPILKYEHQGHPFFLVERMRGVNHEKFSMLLCMFPGCPDRFDLGGGPLHFPETIENPSCHHHSLTFTEAFVEPGIIGCYCDGCEKERHPEAPVYRCDECYFNVHAHCALSEMLPSLVAGWRATAAKSQKDLEDARNSRDGVLRELDQKIKEQRILISTAKDVLEFRNDELRNAKELYDGYVASTIK